MKRMKKLFALLMTLAMVMGLGITGFAADTTNASIKINDIDGATVKYIQIVEPDTSSSTGWKLSDSYASVITGAGVTLQDIIGATANNQGAGKINTDEKLGIALEALRETVLENGTSVTGDTINNITSAGIYLIIPEKTGWTYAPTLAYVPVNSTATVQAYVKGAPDQIQKSIEQQSVGKDGIVKYTVTVEYPFISPNYTDASFTISDKLTNGKLVVDSNHLFSVKVGDNNLDYTVVDNKAPVNDAIEYSIKISQYDSSKAGQTITIIYYAQYTGEESAALSNEVKSSLKLTPNGTSTETNTKVIIHPSKATIKKYDVNNEEIVLKDAEFQIYEYDGTSENLGKGTLVYTKTTNEDGELVFYNLDATKKYYIVETKAPSGYKVDNTPKPLTNAVITRQPDKTEADGTKVIEYTCTDFGGSIVKVPNTTMSALPETGGMGTTLFTIAGCVIMISAAGLFFATRKKAN